MLVGTDQFGVYFPKHFVGVEVRIDADDRHGLTERARIVVRVAVAIFVDRRRVIRTTQQESARIEFLTLVAVLVTGREGQAPPWQRRDRTGD